MGHGRHIGHQHGVSIKSSVNCSESFLRITRRKNRADPNLGEVFIFDGSTANTTEFFIKRRRRAKKLNFLKYSLCMRVLSSYLYTWSRYSAKNVNYQVNHKNYNFLDCDWFKKLLFSTNSLAKLLSDSLLLDSLLSDSLLSDSSISQSHSKL